MDKTSLGDRMKLNYEKRHRHQLIRRMPVIVRVDGKAFHTFTRGMPIFYPLLMDAMAESAAKVSKHIQGFKVAYVQSDEVSFLITDYDSLQTSAWFDYTQNKLESVIASMMTAYFNEYMRDPRLAVSLKPAFFDARAFNIPREEVTNYFVWRAKDWERNSVQMYAQDNFSPKQLHGKKQPDMHEMLHTVGKNWATDLGDRAKNGTFLTPAVDPHPAKHLCDILPTWEAIDGLIHPMVYIDEVE